MATAPGRTLAREPKPITSGPENFGVGTPFRLAMYGEGGVGKTTLALTFPRPLVVDTDGGLEGDAVAHKIDGEVWTPDRWKDLNDLYFWLKENVEKRKYQTIVVDSINTLARLVLREATDMPNRGRAERQMDSVLTTSDQQDYGKVSNALDGFLTNLKILSMKQGTHIVLCSGVRQIDPEKGRMKRTFNVQPAVDEIIKEWANVYGEMVVVQVAGKTKDAPKVTHRILWTSPTDPARNNKTRFSALEPGITDPTFAVMRNKIKPKAVTPATTTKAPAKKASK